jgi:repressor LexA
MLTRKQHELLIFIEKRLKEEQISPSFEEMKTELNLKSKSGIHRLVSALEERGFIRRLANKARALEILKTTSIETSPKTIHSVNRNNETKGFIPNVIPGNFPKSTNQLNKLADTSIELPLYGKVAAGYPIQALADETNKITVPSNLIGTGEHYALAVEGDSMIDAGIFDGDTAIIERCQTAENGKIIVALVDESEVTLKRLRRKHHAIALEPANPNYETRIFGPDQVQVQGQLVGLIRKY